MARTHIVAALVAASFALLLILQLISSFGFPQVTFLNLHRVGSLKAHPNTQTPINQDSPRKKADKDESLYLLGVGKGDITGYVSHFQRAIGTDSCCRIVLLLN